MVKRLVVKTGNPATLLDLMHEAGTSFFCKVPDVEDTFKVVYFSTNREVHFEGKLTVSQLVKVGKEAQEVKSIKIDEFADEIIIEE